MIAIDTVLFFAKRWTSGTHLATIAAVAAGLAGTVAIGGAWLYAHDSSIKSKHEAVTYTKDLEGMLADNRAELQAHSDALNERERQLTKQRERTASDKAALEVMEGEKARLRDEAEKLEARAAKSAADAGVVAVPSHWLRPRPALGGQAGAAEGR
jgi:hypothetical protein